MSSGLRRRLVLALLAACVIHFAAAQQQGCPRVSGFEFFRLQEVTGAYTINMVATTGSLSSMADACRSQPRCNAFDTSGAIQIVHLAPTFSVLDGNSTDVATCDGIYITRRTLTGLVLPAGENADTIRKAGAKTFQAMQAISTVVSKVSAQLKSEGHNPHDAASLPRDVMVQAFTDGKIDHPLIGSAWLQGLGLPYWFAYPSSMQPAPAQDTLSSSFRGLNVASSHPLPLSKKNMGSQTDAGVAEMERVLARLNALENERTVLRADLQTAQTASAELRALVAAQAQQMRSARVPEFAPNGCPEGFLFRVGVWLKEYPSSNVFALFVSAFQNHPEALAWIQSAHKANPETETMSYSDMQTLFLQRFPAKEGQWQNPKRPRNEAPAPAPVQNQAPAAQNPPRPTNGPTKIFSKHLGRHAVRVAGLPQERPLH